MKWNRPFPPQAVVSHFVLSQHGNPRTLGFVANATSPGPKEDSKAREPQGAFPQLMALALDLETLWKAAVSKARNSYSLAFRSF